MNWRKLLGEASVFAPERRLVLLGALVTSAVVLMTFYPILGIGFFAEDYTTLDLAARLSLTDYAKFSFGQCATASFCRPANMFGVLAEYWLFGNNPAAFRIVEILVHLANSLLLYTLVEHISRKWRIGLLSALIYSAIPALFSAFFWVNIIDHSASFFFLSSLLFWFSFLNSEKNRDYLLTMICFLFALLNKEFGIVLPLAYFLMDRWVVAKRVDIRHLVRRYVAFTPIILIYFALLVLRLSAFTKSDYGEAYAGITIGPNIVANLMFYIAALANPLQMEQPIASIAALLVALPLLYFVLYKRDAMIAFLCVMAFLPIIPVLPLAFAGERYLYLSLMMPAILFAGLFYFAWRRLARWRAFSFLSAIVIGLMVYGNATAAAQAFGNMEAFSRQYRLPLRSIFQRHVRFGDDAYVYLVDSPIPTGIASGMFAMRYGAGVFVGGTDQIVPAKLPRRSNSFVYIFDEQDRPSEVLVEAGAATQILPAPPVDFSIAIRLEGYEVVNSKVTRGQSLVVLLYWKTAGRIDQDYTVFAHLVNKQGQTFAGSDSQPRGGTSPTSTWRTGQLILDWVMIPIPIDVPQADDYQLAIGWYYFPTLERASVVDGQRQPIADTIIIQPISVVE